MPRCKACNKPLGGMDLELCITCLSEAFKSIPNEILDLKLEETLDTIQESDPLP